MKNNKETHDTEFLGKNKIRDLYFKISENSKWYFQRLGLFVFKNYLKSFQRRKDEAKDMCRPDNI